MGQGLDVLKTCDGSCRQADGSGSMGRRKGSTNGASPVGCGDWEEEVGFGCHALEDGLKSAVANANRGGARVSDAVLLNHELLQYARQGNVKGVSTALERGAWTETRRPLVMKPQKPEAQGGAPPGGKTAGKDKQIEQPDIGMTALMFASQTGSAECVRRLLWAGAEVNAIEEDGWSPLHFAAKEGHFEVCAALLKGRANPNLSNQDEKTALQVALDEDEAGGDFAERLQALIAGKTQGRSQTEAERRGSDQREVSEDEH
mmetsp:Transcript_146704/g.365830  ORF Transcript_146704/g.365830 Transcript_146704/m.365830 type:complete len:260 (-) Transcript_146704:189-968(-)|eukprot:CAMPEP_0115189510 /NCGR_PEP_ID=MMETSP0270-20121206/11552_1 /TAXON_ID=71861 /ORGANISM="Scrippsiella trochoidea, Strain CCMP3099" /LENGTH=259 /DNA_ID=CAMNT_0002602703 /DNA_START=81 /DNA_END=860 /DNA_ORIENTATION=+